LTLRTGGLACDRLPPVVLPDVLLVRGDARREPVGSADLLKLRRDLAVIQVRVTPQSQQMSSYASV